MLTKQEALDRVAAKDKKMFDAWLEEANKAVERYDGTTWSVDVPKGASAQCVDKKDWTLRLINDQRDGDRLEMS
jgi:hypothetical protein